MAGRATGRSDGLEYRPSSDEDGSEDSIDWSQAARLSPTAATFVRPNEGSRSARSTRPAQAFNRAPSIAEQIIDNSFARRINQWLPPSVDSVPQPALAHQRPSTSVYEIEPLSSRLSKAASQGFSQRLPPILRQAETQNGHHAQGYGGSDQTPSRDIDLRSNVSAHSQDESLGSDGDAEEHYARYRKRRRGVEWSWIAPGTEARRVEEQRKLSCSHKFQNRSGLTLSVMSNLLHTHGKASTEIIETRNRVIVSTINLGNPIPIREGLDFDAVARLQHLLGVLCTTEPTRENNLSGYNNRMLQSAAVKGFQEPPMLSMSYMPPPLPLGSKSIIFLSEILPRSFTRRERSALLNIFRTHATYVPSCINLATGLYHGIQYHVRNPSKPKISWPRLPLGPNGRGWPSRSLPLEVFQIITNYLPRDSLQMMRLVNHEFESKVSNSLFHTVVVAFRPEIYGMMLQNGASPTPIADVKGQGRERPVISDKTVHDGMRTFQGWGPHIKKFAMAFEVEETTLEKPPMKGKFETHPTFWGQYKWPHPHYNRFEFCEGLEKKADEFRCMSAALSNLTGVTELALSIDNGLGWLNGPDISDRARLFRQKPRIFGKKQLFLDLSMQERYNTWHAILKSATPSAVRPGLPNKNGFYEATVEWQPNMDSSLPVRPLFYRQPEKSVSVDPLDHPLVFGGVDVQQIASPPPNEERSKDYKASTFSNAALIPNALTLSQREWLLETEWAQRAFISSFCMALSDNSRTFHMVTTLNLARLSSRYLLLLQRTDIWRALQNLHSLIINVSADWRNIQKSVTGVVEAPLVDPSTAATQFHSLLQKHVSGLKHIKTIVLGYVSGGEHQIGVHGRNKHILPAPIVKYSDMALSPSASTMMKDLLVLHHVEELTLTNCWFPPQIFKAFCTRMRLAKLKRLALKSVSLSFHQVAPMPVHELNVELGTSLIPQGPPLYGNPSVANFFDLRPNDTRDPQPGGWVTTPQRIGSWGEIIDCVTPGANLDFVRYAYQYYDEKYFNSLKRFDPRHLESITFDSCGYVYLTNFKEFQQTALGNTEHPVPAGLAQRALDLALVTMNALDDKMLGQIVSSFPPGEQEVLETGFPMVFGWADKAKAAECLEDGQPLGGSGRFSGKVQRLTFPQTR